MSQIKTLLVAVLTIIIQLSFINEVRAQSFEKTNLQNYFPNVWGQNVLRDYQGNHYSTYTFTNATVLSPRLNHFENLYGSLFQLRNSDHSIKQGELYVFTKDYANVPCVSTYAQLFFGYDKSITEVGDWLSFDNCRSYGALGYRNFQGQNTGLQWSAPWGIDQDNRIFNIKVLRQLQSGGAYTHSGSTAWSSVRPIQYLSHYTLPYGYDASGTWRQGAGKTFNNVIRIAFDHGTRTPGRSEVSCQRSPQSPYSAFYYHMPGYSSYTSEYYLAEGVGIIQEAFLFTEDGSYWGLPNCSGLAFDNNPAWIWYHQ